MDALEQNEDTKLEVEIQDTLDEDTELTDVLKILKEEDEKRRRFTNSKARGRLAKSARANKTFTDRISRICSQPSIAAIKLHSPL